VSIIKLEWVFVLFKGTSGEVIVISPIFYMDEFAFKLLLFIYRTSNNCLKRKVNQLIWHLRYGFFFIKKISWLDTAYGNFRRICMVLNASIWSTVIYHPSKNNYGYHFKFLVCIADGLVVIGAMNEN